MKAAALLPTFAVLGSFTSTISLGSVIVALLVAGGTFVTFLFGIKYKVVADQQRATIENLVTDRNTWKDIAEVRLVNTERLHEEKQALLCTIAQLNEDKARLEALPNLSLIIEQMSKEAKRADDVRTKNMELIVQKFTEAMTKHEDSAQERHRDLVGVLEGLKPA